MIGYSETMTKTIQAALLPLLIIGSLCGLGLFEYPLGRLRPRLTYLYFLTTWSLFGYLFYYLVYNSYTSFFFMTWISILIMLITIVSMLVSLLRFKEFKMCLHKLSIVDDTLEVLGTPKEYRQLHNWVIRIIIGWIVLALFLDLYDVLWLNYEYISITRICVPFVGNHLHHVSTLSSLIWAIILRYTGSRFQRINEHICHLLEDDVESIERSNELILDDQRRTEAIKCKRYVWFIIYRYVHLELCLISRELNKVFSVQMTLEMASYFVHSVDMARLIYTIYITKNRDMYEELFDGIFAYIFVILHSTKLLVLNHICQTVCDKANKTIVILYKLSDNNSDEDLQEQILQFILQIKQRELKFCGMGFFEFGYNFIRKFYVSVAKIVVIIIQMHMVYSYDDAVPINDQN